MSYVTVICVRADEHLSSIQHPIKMSGFLVRVRPFVRTVRGFRTNSILRNVKPEPSTSGAKPQEASDAKYVINEHHLSNFEKRILVFAKKYPSVKDVPDKISAEVMQNCMSKARIRLANYMMALTALSCLTIVIMGNLKKKDKMEEMKAQHDDFRRQITAEFRESVKHDANK
ncbi:Similar to CG9231: UPF0389 protein CG9231 (Drosophila melanogaster) [Cotesia congregata]|uniref:Similar to CG9231: UPF0389 protein CG9231 (Drosophila melanogaster) n=1 Tax=Cotesia congregata TaxID=51543 RepID=A0A8J2HQS6_COTCN|nr:Similar to CG9231: UPF0389 protein CG9231 (Drosophila melanogaster) [Cotesia congregata]